MPAPSIHQQPFQGHQVRLKYTGVGRHPNCAGRIRWAKCDLAHAVLGGLSKEHRTCCPWTEDKFLSDPTTLHFGPKHPQAMACRSQPTVPRCLFKPSTAWSESLPSVREERQYRGHFSGQKGSTKPLPWHLAC